MVGLFHDFAEDAVTNYTPIDEVMQHEVPEGEGEAVAMIPREDYERLMNLAKGNRLQIEVSKHKFAGDGALLMEKAEYQEQISLAKHQTLCAFLRYVWFNAPNLWRAMQNLLAITQKWKPEFIRGMSGAEIARMLGESRQSLNKKSVKLVGMLERWGVSLDDCAGGSRGKRHQIKKAEQMIGRRHRADDYVSDKESIPTRSITERQLRELRRQAEERRLAAIVPGQALKN